MKAIFLTGTARELALKVLLERGVEVVAVVTPFLTKDNSRFKEVLAVASEFGVPIYSVKKDSIFKTLKTIDFDLIISCGFSYILRKDVLDLAKIAINSHPTLLPKYRGYRSGPFIIINNENKSGVTIHYLTEQMDRGDIILQRSFSLTCFDTTKSVYNKARRIEGDLIYEAIQMILNNIVTPIKQDEKEATEYLQIRTPKDSYIDWNKPLKELYNEIRACDPEDYPAYFIVGNQKVCIKLWRPEKQQNETDTI